MLRENEPHPVALLAAGPKFCQRPLVDAAGLSGDEPFKVEWVRRAYFALALAEPAPALATLEAVRRP